MPRAPAATATLQRLPPQALFVLGAISQYVGAALAVLLFASVPAAGVAWLRVVSSAAVLLAWRRPWQTTWTAPRLRLVTAFGLTLAAMNVTFYLAIDRLPLGTAVAIEFCGPIAVAALGSRTRRDFGALALATAGVLLLADVHFAGSPDGLAFAIAAGVAWAGYIVLGHRMAADAGIRPQDGLALGMAIGALGFAPILLWSAVPALVSPPLLAACLAVGVASASCPTRSSRSRCAGCRAPASRCCWRCCRRPRRSSARRSSGRSRGSSRAPGSAWSSVHRCCAATSHCDKAHTTN